MPNFIKLKISSSATINNVTKCKGYNLENLFIEKMHKIINGDYESYPQKQQGTYHLKNDLPKSFLGWDKNIQNEISRLKLNSKE